MSRPDAFSSKQVDVLLLVNAMMGQFFIGIAARTFVVSMPTVALALDADILAVAWALLAYQLAGICLSVVFGRMGDIHGRHRIYGAGFVVMTVSSLLCGLAPSVGWLVAFRLVQGVGAAMLSSATRVLAMDAMPEGAEGRANGFMTMSFHGGLLLGPPLGGIVIDLLSWRWIFFLLAPIGLVGMGLTAARARRPARAAGESRGAASIDYVGSALLVVLTVALTALVDQRSAETLGAGRASVMLPVLAVTLAGFLIHERRVVHPVVNLGLFRIRMFAVSALTLLAFAITSSVLNFLLPFYLQDIRRLSPSFMGLLFLSAPVLTIGLSPLAGRLTDRIGPRIPASIGLSVMMVAFLVGVFLRGDSHWSLAGLLLACTGLGQGFFNTANQTAIVASVPREHRGFATGLVQMVFGLGSLLGISLAGTLLTLMFRHYSGLPDATPSAEHPGPFVAAMNATYAACLALTAAGLLASLLRGSRRAEAPREGC